MYQDERKKHMQKDEWTRARYTLRYRWKAVVLWALLLFGLCAAPLVAWAAATLENPVPGAIKSGVGIVSGWVCDAEDLRVSFDGGPQTFVPYRSERLDTAGVCGDTDNGFGLLWNYNELGDGPHTITLYADGAVVTQVNFSVQTLGTNFLRGVTGNGTVELSNGIQTRVQWEETTQGFTIIGYDRGQQPPGSGDGGEGDDSNDNGDGDDGGNDSGGDGDDGSDDGESGDDGDGIGSGTGGTGSSGGGSNDCPDNLAMCLENPVPASFQSGIGPIWGWVCEADTVEIEINGHYRFVAAYGTELLSTAEACGDTDNGFGMLFNWNLLGNGEHEVVAFADGVEFGRATVRVPSGAEFVRGVEGECVVADFPNPGETVTLVWQQSVQNFIITDGSAPPMGSSTTTSDFTGFLESPAPNSFQSGIGVISGWICNVEEVTIEINGQAYEAAYGTERLDTGDVCGDTDNGFGLLFNWNWLGDGEHTVVARVDGVELGQATVRVTTLGEEFVRDVAGACVVWETVTLEWQESIQNFVITDR